MREGLYPPDSAGAAQVLRLSRYRAARIGVDVNLHTGTLDVRAGRATTSWKAADSIRKPRKGRRPAPRRRPTQKISYITGKWQIMRLLGRYRDAKGARFRLGQFHDDLIATDRCRCRSCNGCCSTIRARWKKRPG